MKTFMVVLALFASTAAFAGRDDVNNGGGLAEKNILYALENLSQYVGLCLNSQTCKITESERDLLNKISLSLPAERQIKDLVQFVSEKAKPGTFVIDGEMKVAKTGGSIGSQIFFNRDLLYLKNAAGLTVPMSLTEAVSHLIHEFGHHHGEFNHNQLDLLGIKVSLLLQQSIQTTPLLPHTNEITAVVINDPTLKGFPQILLYVFGDVINVSKKFESSVKCAKLTLPISTSELSDVNLGNSKPNASMFHNIYWEKHKLGTSSGEFTIKGNLSNTCKDSDRVNFNDNSYKATITFGVERKVVSGGGSKWIYEKDSVEIKQKFEPWWKIIELP